MSTIGSRLQEERERLSLNQTDFGEIGGVKKRAQINYESGERSPDADYLARLAGGGVDVLYVLTGRRDATLTREKVAKTTGEIIPIGGKTTGNLNRIEVMALVIDQIHKTGRTLPSEKLFALVELLLRYQEAGAALNLEAVGDQIRLVS